MKSKALVLILTLLISCSVLAQTSNESAKEDPLKFQVKLFEVKHKSPNVLANAINALGSGRPNSRIDPNDNLKTITVRDLPENIVAIEVALKRLDVPDPAPVSIQTQIYLISASDEAGDAGAIPKEIEPVIAQLKATLKYKNYRYVNTFINRVNDGGSVESSGAGHTTIGANQPTFIHYKMMRVRLATDNQGKEAIRIGQFNFGMNVPIQLKPESVQYRDIGINTELSLSEGGLAVVGTANIGLTDGAMIVVVSAKKVK